jgi:hypothetical protein
LLLRLFQPSKLFQNCSSPRWDLWLFYPPFGKCRERRSCLICKPNLSVSRSAARCDRDLAGFRRWLTVRGSYPRNVHGGFGPRLNLSGLNFQNKRRTTQCVIRLLDVIINRNVDSNPFVAPLTEFIRESFCGEVRSVHAAPGSRRLPSITFISKTEQVCHIIIITTHGKPHVMVCRDKIASIYTIRSSTFNIFRAV